LLWVLTRSRDTVARASRQLPEKSRFSWMVGRLSYAQEGDGLHPTEAEGALLSVLRGGRLSARRELETVPGIWFKEADYYRGLEQTHFQRQDQHPFERKETEDGNAILRYAAERLDPVFDSTDLMKLFAEHEVGEFRDTPNNDAGSKWICWHDSAVWLSHILADVDAEPEFFAACDRLKDACERELLVAYGYRGGSERELEAISALQWPSLYVQSIGGQPAWDKQRHSNRYYGEATEGELGSVLWTSVCFQKTDLVRCFTASSPMPQSQPDEALAAKARSRPAQDRVRKAIKALYSEGVPDQSDLTNKELIAAVVTALTQPGSKLTRTPSGDTILRAANRRK
jgi:hypothetical protein